MERLIINHLERATDKDLAIDRAVVCAKRYIEEFPERYDKRITVTIDSTENFIVYGKSLYNTACLYSFKG